MYFSGTATYLFLVWNLFLGGIPLLIAPLLLQAKKLYLRIILFACWLLFFPNSLYIITDFTHLRPRQSVPLWFDIILLFSAVLNGMMMAFVSLAGIERFLRLKYSTIKSNLILSGCLFLSSFGIYLGRFLRLNSWDVVTNPAVLGNEIIDRLFNPYQYEGTWNVTIVFTLFFAVFYFTIKKLPGVLSRQG
jgi:uncharacterized membrane protein